MKNLWRSLLLTALGFNAAAEDQAKPFIPETAGPFRVEILKEGLNTPWSLKVTPDKKDLLFTSRDGGEISRLNLTTYKVTTALKMPAARLTWQAGMLGMDLDKNFETNGWIYLCYSTYNGKIPENRVSRVTLKGEEKILIDHIPGHATYHNGCQVVVGLDQKLYISTGDVTDDAGAQNPSSLAGKILRINLDGTIPKDNPRANSPVYSVGHRNPLGLAVDPLTGDIWSTEHGPDTRDELNKIVKGGNYGWPTCLGVSDCGNPKFTPAFAEFDSDRTVAISELMFYSGKKVPAWKNNIFFVTLKTARLYRVELLPNLPPNITIMFDWSAHQQRLRDVTESPEGDLIVSTENYPNPTSAIVRLVPQ